MKKRSKQKGSIPIVWGSRDEKLPIYATKLSSLLLVLTISCTNGSSNTPPTRPVQSSNTTGQEAAQPTKVTSRNSSSRNEDEDSGNKEKPTKPRKDPGDSEENNDVESGSKTPEPMRDPLDLALARMTCQAPPIRGDARRLIAYLNNPNAAGANQITQEERRKALASVKDIDVNDPTSLRVLQDELDAACK